MIDPNRACFPVLTENQLGSTGHKSHGQGSAGHICNASVQLPLVGLERGGLAVRGVLPHLVSKGAGVCIPNLPLKTPSPGEVNIFTDI